MAPGLGALRSTGGEQAGNQFPGHFAGRLPSRRKVECGRLRTVSLASPSPWRRLTITFRKGRRKAGIRVNKAILRGDRAGRSAECSVPEEDAEYNTASSLG